MAADGARPQRLPEVVADAIQSEILSGGLVAGRQLPTEPQLAERYAVSRTVVREAARMLEQRGLVDIRAGRGMVVAEPSGAPIAAHYSLLLQAGSAAFDQLMDVRLLVEGRVAELAAAHRGETDLADLRLSLDAAAAVGTDYERSLAEDIRFHALLGKASGNPVLALLVEPINDCLRASYRAPMAYLASQGRTLDEHRAIYDAVVARDPDAARATLGAHLQRVREESGDLLDREHVARPAGRDA